ncbi:hypothetical protein GALL_119170 [mine drainage metagenome]|jgi:hypothetical protein|uniref:Uncharacterized protein n=1 Tax=mine drainage metagenome TaxID=410659 RepID=A0A1J5SQ26_9ZZZZ
MVTRTELCEMVRSGRTAIEYRLLGVLMRPRMFTEADEKELEALKELITRYDELMAVCLEPPEMPEAVGDADGDTK